MEYKTDQNNGDLGEAFQKGKPRPVVGAKYCLQKAEQFTLDNAIFTKDWSITNTEGHEVFRVRGKKVDWCKAKRELVDMDGKTIVLMESKPWSWRGAWSAFPPGNEEQPLWTMRKPSVFCTLGPSLQIFLPSNIDHEVPDYTIKGQWLCKKCTIFFGEQQVAEVVREVSLKNITISKSIFHVLVQPGVDTAFIFSLIVIMDKLYVHNQKNGGGSGGGGGT